MSYRKGDMFVHIKKGTIAVITKVGNGKYDFKHSNPNEKDSTWRIVKDNPEEDITNAIDSGFVVMYRPYTTFLDDDMFEVN